ncbi:MAG: SPFH domain-containing protein [Acidobacteria bacterium]|nr:SPFH domain-containing protein [Acidobacteriota bacterium]
MFGIRYAKFSPSHYVLHFSKGAIRREGQGLAFFYYSPSSSIVLIPMASVGVPFAFLETTSDFQTVTIQGQLTYRVVDHKKLARMLDFTVLPNGKYVTDDFQKLPERLVNEIQPLVRAEMQRLPLKQALVSAEPISIAVLANLKSVPAVVELGLDPMGLNIQSVRANPEIASALEAEARESLQKQADEAIYARRKAAVEQERTIKESELQTELAIEARKREIRERQMQTEIAIEQQRAALTEERLANERKEADGRAYAIEALLKPLQNADPKTLMMLAAQGGDPRQMIALAFQEMAANAGKIGELNISPELLNGLLQNPKR